MNLEEVKQQFPESVRDIEILERLGFASRKTGWIDDLDLEKAIAACWLLGKIGSDRDADALIRVLSGQRRDLWMHAATSLSVIATQRHVSPLLSILETSSNSEQRESVVYALSFLSDSSITPEVIGVLTEIAANPLEATAVRAQALEGLGNHLSPELAPHLDQKALTVMLEALDDAEAAIRFWACFAVGRCKIEAALPKLQRLAQTDKTLVEGWWSVGEEAEDAITFINGGEPPPREPRPSLVS